MLWACVIKLINFACVNVSQISVSCHTYTVIISYLIYFFPSTYSHVNLFQVTLAYSVLKRIQ